jgi:hypothetical protein
LKVVILAGGSANAVVRGNKSQAHTDVTPLTRIKKSTIPKRSFRTPAVHKASVVTAEMNTTSADRWNGLAVPALM